MRFHQLPSAVLHEHVIGLITCGSVIDPAVLLGEIQSLRERGVDIGDRLRISYRAQLVFPYHRRQDMLAEQAAPPGGKLGTTVRGIGPCYADKVSRRWGIRVCELYHARRFRERLHRRRAPNGSELVYLAPGAITAVRIQAFAQGTDQAAVSHVAAPQDPVADVEIDRVTVRHHEIAASWRHRSNLERRLRAFDGPDIGRNGAEDAAPAIDPANIAVERRQRLHNGGTDVPSAEDRDIEIGSDHVLEEPVVNSVRRAARSQPLTRPRDNIGRC